MKNKLEPIKLLSLPATCQFEGVRHLRPLQRRFPARFLAALALVVVSPLIVLLCAIVRVTSSGAALYRQERLGLDGEPFQMIKIRSMRRDAEAGTGAVWATRGDRRVTPIGQFLRWSHFDELPQLVNIIRGEMAFVGPRPERPEFVDKLETRLPAYRKRLAVLPGITGLAQVNLPPDESVETVRKKLAFDLYYIQYATAKLDARIMVATVLRLLGIRYDRGASWLRIDAASLPGFADFQREAMSTPQQASPLKIAA